MGTLKEAVAQLFAHRRSLEREIAAIDQELADVGITAPTAGDPVDGIPRDGRTSAKAAAPRGKATSEKSGKRHDHAQARTQAEADVTLALKDGPLSGVAVARGLNWPKHVVRRALVDLAARAEVIKTGTTGRGVTWALASTTRRLRPTAGQAHDFETVWPPADNPKAPLRALRERQGASA